MRYLLSVAMAFLAVGLRARAYEIESGTVTICDTREQVERLVQLLERGQQLAITVVNAESHDPSACAVVEAEYVPGPRLGMARSRSEAFQITEIVVVGLNTPGGYKLVNPARFFTPVKVKEFAV